MFSRVGDFIKGKEISSVAGLVAELKSSPINPSPVVEELDFIWDWKNFINEKLSKPRLENHSLYHSFLFTGKAADSQFKYKLWISDKEWLPDTGQGFPIKLTILEYLSLKFHLYSTSS